MFIHLSAVFLENATSSEEDCKNDKEGDKSSSKAIPNKHASSWRVKPIHNSSMNSTKMISNFNRLTPESHK